MKINRDVLDVTLESLDLVTVDTDEVIHALKLQLGSGGYSCKYEDSIMEAIYEDDPDWDLTFYRTISIIERDYLERLEIYKENMEAMNNEKN